MTAEMAVSVDVHDYMPLEDARLRAARSKYGAEPELVELVPHVTVMRTRDEVEERLPDILGRALAFSWVDRKFRHMFERDPKRALEAHGVHVPQTISMACETGPDMRPRIVVYEERRFPRRKVRMLHLQLVMLAGK